MGVLVFDIDGTLTDTNGVDAALFEAALRAVFPDTELDPSRVLEEYTDTAILMAICEALLEPDYDSLEAQVHEIFLASLRAAALSEPASFAPVPGAQEIFAEIEDSGWTPAIATGAWRESAELKLRTAQIPTDGIPLATSTERARRVDIIQLAVSQTPARMGEDPIVYVGDGTWDVAACQELGIGFIGRVTVPGSSERLREAGAQVVIDDFSDPSQLLQLLADPIALQPSRR